MSKKTRSRSKESRSCSKESPRIDSTEQLRQKLAYDSVPDRLHWTHGTTYQIMLPSFFDGDNDGTGDLKGATQKLDYLHDLGIEAVWLTAPHLGCSYFGFDTLDHKLINPRWGTNCDLKKFVKQAHERNIKVIIDLVANHTCSDHPWFQKALNAEPKFMAKYNFVEGNPGLPGFLFFPRYTSVNTQFPTSKLATEQGAKDWYYEAFFPAPPGSPFGPFPDLNLDNPCVFDWVIDVARYWICLGVDGFRIDAPNIYYLSFPNDDSTDDNNWNIWQRLTETIRKIKPDTYLVTEYRTTPFDYPELQSQAGLSWGSAFNFSLQQRIAWNNPLPPFLGGGPQGKLLGPINGKQFVDDYFDNILPLSRRYTDAIFLDNHDDARLTTLVAGITTPSLPTTSQFNHIKAIYGVLLTLPGSPYIWQGDEWGSQGDSNATRERLLWAPGANPVGQVTDFDPTNFPTGIAAPAYSPTWNTISYVIPLSTQQADSNSLYSYTRHLIRTRKDYPRLRYGTFEPLPLPGNEPVKIVDKNSVNVTDADVVAYARVLGGWPIWCIFNFGSVKTVTFTPNPPGFPPYAQTPAIINQLNVICTHNTTQLTAVEFEMAQFSSLIVTPVNFIGVTTIFG